MMWFSARILYWKTIKNNKMYHNVFSAHPIKIVFKCDITHMEKNDKKMRNTYDKNMIVVKWEKMRKKDKQIR